MASLKICEETRPVWGCDRGKLLSFGYFSLQHAKKSNSPKAKAFDQPRRASLHGIQTSDLRGQSYKNRSPGKRSAPGALLAEIILTLDVAGPMQWKQPFLNVSMERGMWPVVKPRNQPVLHRIDMHVVDVTLQVG